MASHYQQGPQKYETFSQGLENNRYGRQLKGNTRQQDSSLRKADLSVEKIRDFLQDPNNSQQAEDNNFGTNEQYLEKVLKKQSYLENNCMFDPSEYFGGLEVAELGEENFADKRLDEMFQDYLPTEQEEELEQQTNIESEQPSKQSNTLPQKILTFSSFPNYPSIEEYVFENESQDGQYEFDCYTTENQIQFSTYQQNKEIEHKYCTQSYQQPPKSLNSSGSNHFKGYNKNHLSKSKKATTSSTSTSNMFATTSSLSSSSSKATLQTKSNNGKKTSSKSNLSNASSTLTTAPTTANTSMTNITKTVQPSKAFNNIFSQTATAGFKTSGSSSSGSNSSHIIKKCEGDHGNPLKKSTELQKPPLTQQNKNTLANLINQKIKSPTNADMKKAQEKKKTGQKTPTSYLKKTNSINDKENRPIQSANQSRGASPHQTTVGTPAPNSKITNSSSKTEIKNSFKQLLNPERVNKPPSKSNPRGAITKPLTSPSSLNHTQINQSNINDNQLKGSFLESPSPRIPLTKSKASSSTNNNNNTTAQKNRNNSKSTDRRKNASGSRERSNNNSKQFSTFANNTFNDEELEQIFKTYNSGSRPKTANPSFIEDNTASTPLLKSILSPKFTKTPLVSNSKKKITHNHMSGSLSSSNGFNPAGSFNLSSSTNNNKGGSSATSSNNTTVQKIHSSHVGGGVSKQEQAANKSQEKVMPVSALKFLNDFVHKSKITHSSSSHHLKMPKTSTFTSQKYQQQQKQQQQIVSQKNLKQKEDDKLSSRYLGINPHNYTNQTVTTSNSNKSFSSAKRLFNNHPSKK